MTLNDIHTVFASAHAPALAIARGGNVRPQEVADFAMHRAKFIAGNEAAIPEVLNAAGDNTLAAALKKDFVLQQTCRDFARRVLMLGQFSTVFANVPLAGTNRVQVPFYDLDASDSQNFTTGTGYADIGETVTASREITVGRGAEQGGRVYQALSFSSHEYRYLPTLNLTQLAALKAEKLAFDIVTDVLSVVTAANYGAAAATMAPDYSSDADAIAGLVGACRLWPQSGRSLFIGTDIHAAMLRDNSFKNVFSAGSDAAIREGRLFPRVFGFDYVESPTIPDNSENLVGFACHKSAILCAFAPVPPIGEVQRAGTAYSLYVDPESGVALEYRSFGNNVFDRARHTIEASYGFALGNASALKRIVSP